MIDNTIDNDKTIAGGGEGAILAGHLCRLIDTEGVELSTPVKTQAEDSTPFTDDKIAYYLSTVNGGGKIWGN